jgi:CDP-diacylglycerol pyrophosphatase
MRVLDAEEPDGTNLVQLVREIPGAPGSLKRAGVALLGVTTAGKKRSLLLVVNFQDVAAEDLLDHTCAGVKRPD